MLVFSRERQEREGSTANGGGIREGGGPGHWSLGMALG